jgi:hypothetical protein
VGLRQFLIHHLSLRLAVWSRHLAEGNAPCPAGKWPQGAPSALGRG